MMKKIGKKSKQLPTREGLNALGKTGRTIADYSKASPLTPDEAPPSIMQNLRKLPRK